MKSCLARMVLRCDGSFELGLGHLARCSVLARSLPGVESTFVVRADPVAEDFLQGRGMDFRLLDRQVPEAEEASYLAQTARGLGAGTVVLDKKDNPADYLEVLKQSGLRVVDIEDRGAGRRLADLLVDAHIWPGTAEAACEGPAFCGFGPDWILLDPLYAGLRQGRVKKQRLPGMTRVVVSCGGSDPAGLAGRVVEALAGRPEELRVTVVLGPAADRGSLSCGPHRLEVVRGAQSLAGILGAADLAIVSGGITMCECMCLGLPTLFVPQHGEQAVNARHFADRGGLLLAGTPDRPGFMARLEKLTGKLLTDTRTRRELSRTGSRLVDGLGVERLKKALEKISA
ncbi:MAG: hypothetical protein JXQ83_09470 [Candidatus Glassbacteria bacterium]|nr:hypothetical protein [Candidatus Glassbacteria bacterium]